VRIRVPDGLAGAVRFHGRATHPGSAALARLPLEQQERLCPLAVAGALAADPGLSALEVRATGATEVSAASPFVLETEAPLRDGEVLAAVIWNGETAVLVRGFRDGSGGGGCRLEALPVCWPADYLAFFDSTMARFWWRGGPARDQVREALAHEPSGRWLDDAELEREGCRFAGRDYGDDVFLLDPGALMVPSFMGSRPVRAMHGYDPSHPEMAALLWSNRPLPADVRRLTHVRGFLERELDARAARPGVTP